MDGKVVIGTELNTKSFDAQIKQLESKLELLEKSADEAQVPERFRRSADEARELNVEIEKTRNQLGGLYEKQAKINQQGFTNIQQSLNNVGNSMGNIIKKVAKWGLAIFGIRSMYLGIRQAVSQIMQEDENLKYQIDYMKFAVGQAIKPVVEWIVNLVHQILIWLGAIIKILFGINIFANATASNFKKANSNAQKLKKTLAGFDEMNILNEDGSTGIGGGIGKALDGFGDLAKQVDELAEKLKPFEEDIKGLALLVAGIFGASVIAKWIGNLGTFMGSAGLGKLSSMLANIALVAGGIVLTITILKQTWDDINRVKAEIDGIRNSAEKNLDNWADKEEDIIKLLDTQNAKRTVGLQQLADMHSITSFIYGISGEQLKNAEMIVRTNDKILQRAWQIFNIDTASYDEKKRLLEELQTQIEYNKMVKQELEKQGKNTQYIDDINRDLVGKTNIIYQNINNTNDELYDLNDFHIKDKTMTVKVEANMSEATKQTDNWLKGIWNGAKSVMSMFNPVTAVTSVGSWLGKKIFGAKGMLYTPPKLAVGGLINNPGRGVPIGSALGGERGMEGVIPLTDSQQMALLGEAIGKYISVNITNVTELDGRQIARKVDKIQQNNNFVLNR